MNNLNPEQLSAVQRTEGPVLIIAGPGSGKTHTLVERIVYLISEKGVQPENILISTFTEKAAAELITRVSTRLHQIKVSLNLNEMYIGTLHSLALRIIKEYREYTRLNRNYALWDDFDQQYKVYQNIDYFNSIENIDAVIGKPASGRWSQAEKVVHWVNKITEEMIEPQSLLAAKEPEVKALAELIIQYREFLHGENALDFSHIQFEAYHLIKDNPGVLDHLLSKIHYLMVDEYQDTNTVQEALIFLLAGEKKNLCVVGDDDQGLYRFRGATIRNILEFNSHFKEGDLFQIKLTENYRSHPGIIDFYNNWMEKNEWAADGRNFRFDKEIKPQQDKKFVTTPSVFQLSASDVQENWHKEIHAFIQSMTASGAVTDYNQISFLFYSVKNDKVLGLANYLETNGIAVYSPRSNLFFERDEVRLMFGALIFLFPDFQEIIETKWRGNEPLAIWDYFSEDCLNVFVEQLQKPENVDLKKWCLRKAKFHQNLDENTNYAFSGLFYELLQFSLFAQHLGDTALGGIMDSRAARNLSLFSKLLTRFEYLHSVIVLSPEYIENHIHRLFNYYIRFLKDGGLDEFEDPVDYAPTGCVSFLTIHQSKGLEFPVAIVGSLESVPRKHYTDLDEILQSKYYKKPIFEPLAQIKFFDYWRLYYTAFSRAKSLLMLSTLDKREGHSKSPSKYILQSGYDELPDWKTAQADLQKLSLDKVKKAYIKNDYSFTSHIAVYESCALQYKFFKELDFEPVRRNAMLFGRVVHQTIEDMHKAAIRGEADTIQKDNISNWFYDNYKYLSSKEKLYLAPAAQQIALNHVLGYHQYRNGDWSKIHEAEVDVSLVKEDYILSGQIDLIEGKDGTVEIIDFKTEKKPDLFDESERVAHFKRQLELYGHLVETRYNKKVSKLHLYFTGEKDANPLISIDMKPESVEKTLDSFDAIVSKIENKKYDIKERPVKLCKNCDMKEYCDQNC